MPTVESVNEQQIEKRVSEQLAYAQNLTISTPEQYQDAGEKLKVVRSLRKEIAGMFKAIIDPIKASLEAARSQEKKYITPVEQVDGIIVAKMGLYDAEIARQAREEAAAQARAEAAERQRLADIEAERVRKENEEKRKKAEAEAARLKAEGDKKAAAATLEKAKADDERRQKKAEADAQAERERLARQSDEDAKKAAANAVIPDAPKVEGISKGRTIWKFRITDPDKIPHAYCIPDETAIGGVVRAMADKGKAEKAIPGIEVWSETSKVGVKV